MKRYGNLWPSVTSFENLLIASRKAQKGKRYRENVLRFNFNREFELLKIQSELQQKRYRPGAYRTFEIIDPKPRRISAAPYRDRVVHHALCNVIVPLIEPSFIDQTFANRLGYGTHRALALCVQFCRKYRYVLQCDIRQYFPSIDLTILKKQIRQKIKCAETLWLIDTIIDASNPQIPVLDYFPGDNLLTPITRRRGLPIGNLTSQFFANLYLTGFDHYVKETLKVKAYVRYVDDFCCFAEDQTPLADARQAIESYLASLRLKIHPIKSQLYETCHGVNFLGFRIFHDRIRVRNDNVRRGRQRLRILQDAYHHGELSLKELTQSLQSWEAHLKVGDTYQLRQDIFGNCLFHPPGTNLKINLEEP